MQVTFGCGDVATVSPSVQDAPVCACGRPGCARIVRVKAPAPSIRGVCSGPIVTTQPLDPIAVNLCLNGAKPLPVPVDPSIEPQQKAIRKLSREAH